MDFSQYPINHFGDIEVQYGWFPSEPVTLSIFSLTVLDPAVKPKTWKQRELKCMKQLTLQDMFKKIKDCWQKL
jgi:hypothetical protein